LNADRNLSLVVPVERVDGTLLYVHSMPLSQEVFQRYFMVISKTFSQLYQENMALLGGPRVAAMMLRDVAQNTLRPDGSADWWSGKDGVENGLMNEVRRLTNVVVNDGSGWVPMPYMDALSRKLIDDEDVSEIEGALVFFMVNFAMHRRQARGPLLRSAAGLFQLQITSSSLSDFRSSLTTSTSDDDTEPKGEPFSMPS
jgi:hypothetical protein